MISQSRVPIVEQARLAALPHARHDWLLTVDPDEVAPPGLPGLICQALQAHPQAGVVRAPIQFYFVGRPLKTTVWGRSRVGRPLLFHRQRSRWAARIHAGYQLLEGFSEVKIEFSPENAIQHYWAQDYRQLFEKHRRYLAHEGRSRYANGQRFSWFRLVTRSLWDLKLNFIDYRGLLGGRDGWGLSLFHAWYVASCWLALRAYQHSLMVD